ncbi:PulJ/GspJ family protein [Flavobacterium sp. DSP2-3-1]|uniref:PulJ/GspJ family protein n=1 Tax=unclassified Flavobacterium TaxID=196869 RepID=UPI003CF3E6CD
MFKPIMNNTNSIPAFSLIEAIVSMAITAIIMGIVFVIFSIVTERMLDYKNQNELVNDINRLTYSVNKDIFENEKMMVSENEVIFNGYAGETVKYNFQEEYILRSTEIFIDTFKIKLKQIVIDSVKNKSQRIVFQKLKLNVKVNEREMDLKFYKRVYANELLQAIKE